MSRRRRGAFWRRRSEPRDPFAVFLRGLGIGALVGAAIAGSRIWLTIRRPHRGSAAQGAMGAHAVPPADPSASEGRGDG